MFTGADLEAIPKTVPAQRLPLSHQQEAIWLLNQFLPPQQQCAFNLCYEFEFLGLPDVEALSKAVTALGFLHPALRTRIVVEEASVCQSIEEEMPMLVVVDFRQRPDASTDADKLARTEAKRIINTETGPLSSFTLVYVNEELCRLLMNIHHIIADGISIHIIHIDLAKLYVSFSTGTPVTAASTGAYCQQFLVRGAGNSFTEDERYWSAEFSPKIPSLPLRQQAEGFSQRTFHASRLDIALDQKLIHACLHTGYRLHAPLSAFLLSGFVLLLAKFTGEWHMMIGTGFTGRHAGDPWQHSVGLFANAVPLVVRLDPKWGQADIVRHVTSKYIGAYDHQDYPLQRMLTRLVPSRDPEYPTPFRIGYNYQSLPAARADWGKVKEVRFDRVYCAMCPFDLVLDLMLSHGSGVATFVYATDLFSREGIATIAEHYIQLLHELVSCQN